MELGTQIKKYRQELQISQEELADRVYVSRQTISNWENDNVLPSVEMLIKMADFFGVSTDFLLGRTPTSVISVDGLTEEQQSHVRLLVGDFLRVNQKNSFD